MSNPNDKSKTTADTLKEDIVESPLHEAVFGSDPDGFVNDTPEGAIGENVNYGLGGVQLDRNQPLRHIGDSDAGDFQPGGGRRR
ncbi:MAG: hypothetical protein Q8R02_12330 [Hyphomonadaceae bacterium]|nr:hypothetical protein [Hyphomonadaceae bacterium]